MVSTDTRTELPEATASSTRGSNDSHIHGYPHILDTGSISMFGVVSGQSLSQQQWPAKLQIRELSLLHDGEPNREVSTIGAFHRLVMVYRGEGQIQLLSRYIDTWFNVMPSRQETSNSALSASPTWPAEMLEPDGARPSDPLNITRQLTELRDLKDGWADGTQNIRDWGSGFGKAPSHDGLDWLASKFERFYSSAAPRPYIYPTPEGGVQAEWSLGDIESSLEIDIDSHTAEWFRADLKADSSEDRTVNLDDPTDWQWVADQLRRDAN